MTNEQTIDIPVLTPVKSSNIDAIGYSGSDLFVKFKNGDTWRYAGVHPKTYEDMLSSHSVGSFLHKFIKPVHPGTKVPVAKPAEPASEPDDGIPF